MFWGLIMEPKRRYSQVVKRSFHVSMASLDISSTDNEPCQVMVGFEGRNYLLCTLQKENVIQCPLDLNFEVGDEISFASNGKSHVHLTGYINDDILDEEEEDEGKDEQFEESDLGSDSVKRKGKSIDGPPRKKSKTEKLLDAINDENSDDSDDSDVNFSSVLSEEVEEEEEESDEEEESEEDAGDEENVEEEESDCSDSSSISEDEKPKQNGFVQKNLRKGKLGVGTLKKDKLNQQKEKSPKGEKSVTKNEISPNVEKKKKFEKSLNEVTPKPVKTNKGTGKTPKSEKNQKGGKEVKEAKTPQASQQEGSTPKKRTVEGGVIIEDIVVGGGNIAKPGRSVQVYYEGRLKQNNKVFDSTKGKSGFRFNLGRQEVIKAWDIGVSGMKVGGKRRITCPPNTAYGAKGSPPVIPPNSTLVFEVELKNVN